MNITGKNPVATITTYHGEIVIELYPQYAPNTVNSFIFLANQGLFDNRAIKRIVPGFVLQPSYSEFDDERCAISLEGEYSKNGFDNKVPFEEGTVAMGGNGNVASGSCFFITLSDEAGKSLDGKYAAFGKVAGGWEEVKRIEAVPTKEVETDMLGVIVNEPVEPEYIKTVIVETWGTEYPEPVMIQRPKD